MKIKQHVDGLAGPGEISERNCDLIDFVAQDFAARFDSKNLDRHSVNAFEHSFLLRGATFSAWIRSRQRNITQSERYAGDGRPATFRRRETATNQSSMKRSAKCRIKTIRKKSRPESADDQRPADVQIHEGKLVVARMRS
jgi:hypothetical protein